MTTERALQGNAQEGDADMRAAYEGLATKGVVTPEALDAAFSHAHARGLEPQQVLLREMGVSKEDILQTLAAYYGCLAMRYDERLPVPPELLTAADGERLSLSEWFPLMKERNVVVIAAARPHDALVRSEARACFPGAVLDFRVALHEDIQWYIQDFLHARPGNLIGTFRTGLAYWRNTMAHWRTRMACYRTDLAQARTSLAQLRWGLGMIALSDALMRLHRAGTLPLAVLIAIGLFGFLIACVGLAGYVRVRKSRMSPPPHTTLVEVTAATISFLEDYHFINNRGTRPLSKKTMLGRLGDYLQSHCTILYPKPSSRERTQLARERNVLAAQRTVAACYRTLYARARTGLAFIRTGISFAALSLGFAKQFRPGLLSTLDVLLFLAGLLMVTDGVRWYLPVRQEHPQPLRGPEECVLQEGEQT